MATIVAMWQITWFSAMATIVAIGKLESFSKERLANKMSTSKKRMAGKGLKVDYISSFHHIKCKPHVTEKLIPFLFRVYIYRT